MPYKKNLKKTLMKNYLVTTTHKLPTDQQRKMYFLESQFKWLQNKAQKRLPKKLQWILEDIASAAKGNMFDFVKSVCELF